MPRVWVTVIFAQGETVINQSGVDQILDDRRSEPLQAVKKFFTFVHDDIKWIVYALPTTKRCDTLTREDIPRSVSCER